MDASCTWCNEPFGPQVLDSAVPCMEKSLLNHVR
jgi:hypothetical protein